MRNKYRFVLTCIYGYNILEEHVRGRLKEFHCMCLGRAKQMTDKTGGRFSSVLNLAGSCYAHKFQISVSSQPWARDIQGLAVVQ